MEFLRKLFGLSPERKKEPQLIRAFEIPTETGGAKGAIWKDEKGEYASLVMENPQKGIQMRFDRDPESTQFHLRTPTGEVQETTRLAEWPNGQIRPTVETHRRSRISG